MRHFRLALLAFGLSIGAFPRGADAQIVEGSSGPAYRINPGDELEILVWGDERLHRSTRVLPDGTFAFPPLWGKDSFNWGAGMHRVDTAAGFIKANMPYGRGGMLTEQQAWDVALFMNSHERPKGAQREQHR